MINYTHMEKENFDAIAAGEAEWVKTVDNFYHTFHPLIEDVPSGKMAARELGVDPQSGEPIFARISKNGPCVQMGNSDTEKPPGDGGHCAGSQWNPGRRSGRPGWS